MTKKEYIERETAMHIVKSTCGDYATAFSMIRKLPAADVVEVVRCKDCKYYGTISCPSNIETFDGRNFQLLGINDFCSRAERKELDNG